MAAKTQRQYDDELASETNLQNRPAKWPVSDPTELTRLALLREIRALREILEARIEGGEARIEAKIDGRAASVDGRFGGMDKAIGLLQDLREQGRVEVESRIDALRTLHEEKFFSIATQFAERDVRTETSARDSKVAVDAALQAAKEAVAEQNRSSAAAISKSELATTKQIDGQATLIATTSTGLNDKIEDVKDRLNRLEGERKGTAATWAIVAGLAGVVITAAVAFALKSNGAPAVQPTTAYVPAPVVQVAPTK